MHSRPPLLTGGLLAAALLLPVSAHAQQRAGIDLFEKRIRPALVRYCYECHAGDAEVEGGLRLDSRAALRKGGESGPVLVAGKPDESLIVSALEHDGLEMPPDKKLPEGIVADFKRWIALGAPDPRDRPGPRDRRGAGRRETPLGLSTVAAA